MKSNKAGGRSLDGWASLAVAALGVILMALGLLAHARGSAGTAAFLAAGGFSLALGLWLNRGLRQALADRGRDVPDVRTDMIPPRDLPPGAPPPSTGLC
jgi:hypothetical protein